MIAVAGEVGEEGFVVAHNQHFERLRKAIGQEIPTYILAEGFNEDKIVDFGNNIFGANPQSQVFLDKVLQLAGEKQVVLKTPQGNLDSQIEACLAAYRGNFPDLGVDDNTAIIHAFLRWDHLSPVDVVAEEFDPFILKDKPIEKIPDNQFSKDLRRIKNMTKRQRTYLAATFNKALGKGRTRVRGFAIDPITLQYEITAGYGTHRLAAKYLARRLWGTDELRALQNKAQIDGMGDLDFERFIIGDLIPDINNKIRTPVLLPVKTYESGEAEGLRRAGSHLLRQKICIPVDRYMNLIDENYASDQ
jgi:hypothetical protein